MLTPVGDVGEVGEVREPGAVTVLALDEVSGLDTCGGLGVGGDCASDMRTAYRKQRGMKHGYGFQPMANRSLRHRKTYYHPLNLRNTYFSLFSRISKQNEDSMG